KKLLTVRMVDPTFNANVLKSTTMQQKIIADSVKIAKTYEFDGIVLDFEYNALAFDSVVQSISQFSTHFSKATHLENMVFYEAVYGDTFARLRPYDMTAIAKN